MISLVIPVWNERESLRQLHREINEALEGAKISAEIIFVDDGSTDGSWLEIEEIARGDNRVRGLGFRRNFGKAMALGLAFSEAKGEYIVTLDADLQDDPHEISRLLDALNTGFDLVTGWKKRRHDPWHKVIPSRVFNRLVGFLTGLHLHDHNCGLKAYRIEVVREIVIYGEMHRFITVLAYSRGFRVEEIEVNHRRRMHGRSKYGASRFLKGFLDLLTVRFITSFGERPLHLFGGVGLLSFLVGLLSLAYLALRWFSGLRPIGNRPLLFYGIAFLLVGVNLITFGVLAEFVTWRLAQHDAQGRGSPAIVKRTGNR
jgi:glycosyltransferase involved in cell wall biosynthesis